MLSAACTFRILATLRSARRLSPRAPFVHVTWTACTGRDGRRTWRGDQGRAGGTRGRARTAGTRAAGRRAAEPETADRRAQRGQGSDDGQGNRDQVRVDRQGRDQAEAPQRGGDREDPVALAARRDELQAEYDQTLSEITELQRDRLTDSAGDDQADTGTKTFEREQEISLANNILERITQVERALERLDEGSYGWCERCGNADPGRAAGRVPVGYPLRDVQAAGGAALSRRPTASGTRETAVADVAECVEPTRRRPDAPASRSRVLAVAAVLVRRRSTRSPSSSR